MPGKNKRHSPVLPAHAKLHLDREATGGVGVHFDSVESLDALISALTELRDSKDFDHVHLMDKHVGQRSHPSGMEIVFHQPGVKPDWHDRLFSRYACVILKRAAQIYKREEDEDILAYYENYTEEQDKNQE